MRTNTTTKSFALALVLTTALTAPLLAGGRDDARRNLPQRDTGNVIIRVINRITHLIHSLSDQVVVPQPLQQTTT